MCLKALPERLASLIAPIIGLLLAASPAGQAALSDPVQLDVSAFFHTNFLASGYKGPGLAFPRTTTVDGLPFQLTGQAGFYGRTLADRGTLYQERADGIVVGRTFQELHVVHHAFWMDSEGLPIAVIQLNYADGSKAEFPVRYGAHVRDWFKLPSEPKEAMADPNTLIFWRGSHSGAERLKATLRLFKSRFLNPHPDRLVGTISVVSTRQQASYSLLAMTIAGTDVNRPKSSPAEPLEPEAEFDGAVKITVLDADTGKPIAGARLEPGMSVNGAGVISPVLVTPASGEQTIRYPTKTTTSVNASVEAEGYAPANAYWRATNEGIPAEHTFRLKPGQLIGGWVRDETGAPISAARINLTGHTGDGNYFNTGFESDQEGRWTGTGPKSLDGLNFDVLHRDFPSARYVTSASIAGSGTQVLDLNLLRSGNAVIILPHGLELTGVVRDESGGPIPNATLRFGTDPNTRNVSTAKTDEQGAFTLKKLRAGVGLLTAQAPNCAPHEQEIEIRAGMEPLVIVLGKGNTIRGLVVDESGKPVEDVDVSLVTVYRPNSGPGIQWKAKTDADGRFNWGAAPANEVQLSFRKNGFRSLTKKVKPSAEIQNFVLGGTQRVFGTVVDAKTGGPVQQFRITPGWRVSFQGSPKDTNTIPRADWQDYQSKTFTDGKFDFPVGNSPYGYMPGAEVDLFIRVDAEDYTPSITPAIKSDDLRTEVHFELARGEAIAGKLVDVDGRPASNVVLRLVFAHGQGAQFNAGKLVGIGPSSSNLRSDGEGNFKVPPQLGGFLVAAETPLGIGTISGTELKSTGVLQLKPWARVEGVWKNGKRPVSGGTLGLGNGTIFSEDDFSKPRLSVYLNTTTSRDGTFHFDRVPAGSLQFYERIPVGQNGYRQRALKEVEIRAGITNVFVLGSEGVLEVIGQLVRPEGLDPKISLTNGNFEIRRSVKPPPVPAELKEQKDVQDWFNDWMKTPEGKDYVTASQETYTVSVTPGGRISADGLKPGKYVFNAWIRESASGRSTSSQAILASANKEFELKAPEDSKDAEPHDLGKIDLRLHRYLKIGQKAPDFSIKTVDGKPLKLSDFKGKYVLLDFWATWCGPCVAELPHMKETFEKHGGNERFAMIGLSLDNDAEAPKKFAEKNDVKWIQGFLGEWSKTTLPKEYGVEGIPSLFLIDPEGRIAALNFRGINIEPTVAKALQNAK